MCAVCLFWGADLWLRHSWQMSTIQNSKKSWLATGSLLAVWWRMRSLGLRLPLSSSGCHPPDSLPLVGDGLVRSLLILLWYSLSPLFCEWAWQCLRLELFMGKLFLSLSFFLAGYPTVWVAVSR